MLIHRLCSPANPARVVMLGASGFLARDLDRELSQSHIEHLSIGSGCVDLCRPESVDQLAKVISPHDALVILSALTPDRGKDVTTFTKNIAMISHLCAFFENHSCQHVIYLSSDAVYSDENPLVSEATPLSPKGLYAMMHAAREQMLECALAKPAIPLCIVRPCAVYGPEDTHNSYGPNRFIRAALNGRKITLFGGGEEERDHVYIRDVSRFLTLCLLHQAEGAFNITSGRSISFLELAKIIARLSPDPVEIDCLPRTVPITHRRFDVSLRRKFFPTFDVTDLEQGLSATMQALSTPDPSPKSV